jgi:hypothetical protein
MDALAHPLTEPGGLAIPPLAAAVLAILLLASVARYWPGPGKGHKAVQEPDSSFSWWGRLGALDVAGRVVGVAIVALSVVAGRLGSESQLENVAPALVVGAGWPLLLLASAIVGPLWRWLDPWDGLARPVAAPGEPGGDVRWAVAPALAWVWYLGAFPDALDPRAVGIALGAYTILTAAGCLAMGRRTWLSRAEPFGLLFGWLAMLPRRLLSRWSPPRGAEVVLGVLAGGLVFGAIRLSTLWGELNAAAGALFYATSGLVAAAAGFGALLWAASRRAERIGAPGSVAASAVPAIGGLAVSLALSRNRFFTSIQLLPGLLADPFGSSEEALTLNPSPLGETGLIVLQVLVLLLGCLAGAILVARRTEPSRRAPGMAAVAAVAAGGILSLTAT